MKAVADKGRNLSKTQKLKIAFFLQKIMVFQLVVVEDLCPPLK
jgi:hypothetical protein